MSLESAWERGPVAIQEAPRYCIDEFEILQRSKQKAVVNPGEGRDLLAAAPELDCAACRGGHLQESN